MFVTNHVLAGATIGVALRRHPAGAFAAGVVSHVLMDSCPHWAVDRARPDADERFLRAARCDGCAGLSAMALGAAVAPGPARRAVVAAMAGAAVMDLDKPFLHFFGFDPFPRWFSRFHQAIQRESPRRLPHELAVGVGLAALGGWSLRQARRPAKRG